MLTDFSKAFDLIDHKLVIIKSLDLGVTPSIVQWVVDFLTNRRQRVKYKDTREVVQSEAKRKSKRKDNTRDTPFVLVT